ncbi:MAG: hypothetical protein R3F11_29910 [Verrucomicrobiales bacterium]
MTRAILALAAIALLAIPAPPAAALSTMEQIEGRNLRGKLREVERYQLKIAAEKHYEKKKKKKGEFAIALAGIRKVSDPLRK